MLRQLRPLPATDRATSSSGVRTHSPVTFCGREPRDLPDPPASPHAVTPYWTARPIRKRDDGRSRSGGQFRGLPEQRQPYRATQRRRCWTRGQAHPRPCRCGSSLHLSHIPRSKSSIGPQVARFKQPTAVKLANHGNSPTFHLGRRHFRGVELESANHGPEAYVTEPDVVS